MKKATSFIGTAIILALLIIHSDSYSQKQINISDTSGIKKVLETPFELLNTDFHYVLKPSRL